MPCPDPTPEAPRPDHNRSRYVPPQRLTPGGPVHGGFTFSAGAEPASLPARLTREFHEALGLPIDDMSKTTNALRAKLIAEEATEVIEAIELMEEAIDCRLDARWTDEALRGMVDERRARLAKELADLEIALHGTALTMGIDLDVATRLVHESNMSKVGVDGKPIIRADGKVMKGAFYREPDMSAAIRDVHDSTR